MYIEFPEKIHEKLLTLVAGGVTVGVSGLEMGGKALFIVNSGIL